MQFDQIERTAGHGFAHSNKKEKHWFTKFKVKKYTNMGQINIIQ